MTAPWIHLQRISIQYIYCHRNDDKTRKAFLVIDNLNKKLIMSLNRSQRLLAIIVRF